MKKKVSYKANKKTIEREINYIPVRYIFAVLITLLEILAIISTASKQNALKRAEGVFFVFFTF